METRKNPRLDNYRHSPLFFQVGLLITMALIVGAFEWRSKAPEDTTVTLERIENDMWINMPITKIEVPKPPKPKIQKIPVAATNLMAEIAKTLSKEVETPVPIAESSYEITPGPPVEVAPEFHDYAPVMPAPENGYDEFYRFLGKNITYPRKANTLGVEGKVYVRFIVNEEGSMSNIEIIKGIGSGCDEEVLRVMNLTTAPRWNPGRSGGRKVRVRMMIPVEFRLK